MPADPFSDTVSPQPALPADHVLADTLARRINRPDLVGLRPGRWETLIFVGQLAILDRIDSMEAKTNG